MPVVVAEHPRQVRDRTTGYRIYSPAEQRAAYLVAVLRAGGSAFPIIDAAIATMRSNGSLDHALAHLSRRDEQVHHLSLRRLQASPALHAYLAKYYSPE